MLRYFSFLLISLLTACQTYHFANEQAELSFAHLDPISINVHDILITNHYPKNTSDHINQAYALNDSPRETLTDLMQSKIIPTLKTHSKSYLKFHIIDAKITQEDTARKTIFEGTLKVHLETLSIEREFTKLKDFEIYAVKDAPLGITLAEKETLIFELNEALMQKFYDAFLHYKSHSLSTI